MSSGHSWGETEAGSRQILANQKVKLKSNNWKHQIIVQTTQPVTPVLHFFLLGLSLTWGPDGRLNHAGAGCHSERERWGAEATSPTPPGCSAGDRQRAKVIYQVTVQVDFIVASSRQQSRLILKSYNLKCCQLPLALCNQSASFKLWWKPQLKAALEKKTRKETKKKYRKWQLAKLLLLMRLAWILLQWQLCSNFTLKEEWHWIFSTLLLTGFDVTFLELYGGGDAQLIPLLSLIGSHELASWLKCQRKKRSIWMWQTERLVHHLPSLASPLQTHFIGSLSDGYVKYIQQIWEMFHLFAGLDHKKPSKKAPICGRQ